MRVINSKRFECRAEAGCRIGRVDLLEALGARRSIDENIHPVEQGTRWRIQRKSSQI